MAERVADVGDGGQGCAFAVIFAGHEQRQETVAFGGRDRLGGKRRIAIDDVRMGGRYVGDHLRSLHERERFPGGADPFDRGLHARLRGLSHWVVDDHSPDRLLRHRPGVDNTPIR